MGDMPEFPQGKGCILPLLFLIICGGIFIGAFAAYYYAVPFPRIQLRTLINSHPRRRPLVLRAADLRF